MTCAKGLPDQVGDRLPLVKSNMAVSEEDVPGWIGTVPAFGVGRVGEDGATEDDGLRRIGQTVHGQAVQTVGGGEGRILSAIEDVRIANPLEQVGGGFVHGAA